MTRLTPEQIAEIKARHEKVRKKCDAWLARNRDFKPMLEDMPITIADANEALYACDALLSHIESDGWQTMETAPRDGTEVDLAGYATASPSRPTIFHAARWGPFDYGGGPLCDLDWVWSSRSGALNYHFYAWRPSEAAPPETKEGCKL